MPHVYDIGRAIEDHAKAHRLGVVRAFIGHGIGEQFHGALQILHYFDPRADTVIEPGMTFTIEPMITLGLARPAPLGRRLDRGHQRRQPHARSSSTPWWSPTTAPRS